MEEKFEKLKNLMATEGLTCNDVIGYCKAKQDEEKLIQERKAARRQKIAEFFPPNDVRSKALLYDYAFEGGKFASNHDAYPNCQGVVGWINPDPNAPEGERVYVVLPELNCLKYSTEDYCTGANDLYDGRANTKTLLENGREWWGNFPAAEYAYNYAKNGVKQGEAFLPARGQLRRIVENADGLREALKKIDGKFEGMLMSSSEDSRTCAWFVDFINGNVQSGNKRYHASFSCIIAY